MRPNSYSAIIILTITDRPVPVLRCRHLSYREISICFLNKNIVTLRIYPFCRGRETKEFNCDFVAGFIERAYNDPAIAAREISCHATGDKHCKFKIFKNSE